MPTSDTSSRRAAWRPFFGLAALWLVSSAALLAALAMDTPYRSTAAVLSDDIGRALIALGSAWACARRARIRSAASPSWRALAWGLGLYGAATVYLVLALDLLQLRAPWSLLRHLGYFAALGCMARAALLWPSTRGLRRLRSALDGLMVAAAAFFIAWGLWLGEEVARVPAWSLPYALTLAYPAGYLALGTAWCIRVGWRGNGTRELLLGAAVLLLLVHQALFGALSISGAYRTLGVGESIDLCQSTAFLAFGLAALWPLPTGSRDMAAGSRMRPGSAFSYAPAVAALAFGGFHLAAGRQLGPVMALSFGVLVFLLCWRQYLAQRDLEELASTLERRVEERSAELRRSQQELHLSRRLQVVATVSAGMAHDLKNLLGVVLGWADILAEDPGQRRAREGLETIRNAADKASLLMEQLMATGRQQALQPRLFDIGARIRNLRPLLEGALGEAVRLVLEEPPEPLPVFMDPEQLDRVLLNLASNARNAMAGGGRFLLGWSQDPIESFVRLEAEDTGQGIPPELVDRIFDPFFTTRASEGGTGLGLSSVQGILLQSGGSIAVSSAPGLGTRFLLRLPQRDPDSAVA